MKALNAILVLLLGVLLVASFSSDTVAFTDDEIEKHPIDVEFEKRIDADPSTSGMMEASRWGENEWDKLLNENYKSLMKKLDKEAQTRLKNSQREWISFAIWSSSSTESFMQSSTVRCTALSPPASAWISCANALCVWDITSMI